MNVRELLRYEIWNKRTTLIILLGLGSAPLLALVGFFGWHEIDVSLLTTGERDSARAAFVQIDEFDQVGKESFSEYVGRVKGIEAKLQVADKATRTSKDEIVDMLLVSYFADVLIDQRRRMIQEGQIPGTSPKNERNLKFDPQANGRKLADYRRIHAALD
jgi:hypothetical protein